MCLKLLIPQRLKTVVFWQPCGLGRTMLTVQTQVQVIFSTELTKTNFLKTLLDANHKKLTLTKSSSYLPEYTVFVILFPWKIVKDFQLQKETWGSATSNGHRQSYKQSQHLITRLFWRVSSRKDNIEAWNKVKVCISQLLRCCGMFIKINTSWMTDKNSYQLLYSFKVTNFILK